MIQDRTTTAATGRFWNRRLDGRRDLAPLEDDDDCGTLADQASGSVAKWSTDSASGDDN